MSVRILVGDVRERLKELPDESVHCVVTSPPYFGLREYGVDGQIGLESSIDEHVSVLVETFREVRRVMRNDATLWMNYGDMYATGTNADRQSGTGDCASWTTRNSTTRRDVGLKPKDLVGMPWRIAFGLQADGWWLRSDIIWHKPNPMPESVTDRPTKSHEYVFLLSKSARYYYDADAVREPMAEASAERYGYSFGGAKNRALSDANKDGVGRRTSVIGNRDPTSGRNLRTVWTISTEPFPGSHFAVFPTKLVEPCIKAGTSERGCCAECGAPWERVVEREGFKAEAGRGAFDSSKNRGVGRSGGGVDQSMNGLELAKWRRDHPDVFVGFRPTCTHNYDPVPCTVLDPFGGAGTTGLVADRLGRNAILIELNPTYADMARNRLRKDCPMFTKVEVVGNGVCLT